MPQRPELLLISPCSGPVRGAAPAGVEAIVFSLAEGLRARYNLHLLATPDSSPPEGVRLIACRHEALPERVALLLRELPGATCCDHSGAALLEGAHPRFFRVFHVEPRYVFTPAPSRRCGFVSEYLRGLFADQVDPSFAACPVVQNGIASPGEATASASVSGHGGAVYLGRVNRLKGLDLAAAACAALGIALHIYGGFGREAPPDIVFNDLPLLDELSVRYPGLVHYHGPLIEPREKQRILAEAGVVLVPSREPESCSLVALEAVAAGAPVAAFRHGGLVEYLGAHPGVSFAPYTAHVDRNVSALARSIQQALTSPRTLQRLPEAYTAAAMVARYRAWLAP